MVRPHAVVNEYANHRFSFRDDSRMPLYSARQESFDNRSIFERRDAMNAGITEFQRANIRMGAFASLIAIPFRAIGHLTESANLLDSPSDIGALETHYTNLRAQSDNNVLAMFKDVIVDGYTAQFNQSLRNLSKGNYFTAGYQMGSLASDLGGSFVGLGAGAMGSASAMRFTYKGAKHLGRGALESGRRLILGVDEFLASHHFNFPITFQFSTHLNSGLPLQGIRFHKLFEFSSNKQHTRNLEKILGATVHEEHVDFVAGSGGAHVYENFARAREAAKLRAGVGDDVIPFLQEKGPYRNKVYTGMQSKDGTRGWRLDFDPIDQTKGAHINWWYQPDSKQRITYYGMIKIDCALEGDYIKILSHFPGFAKPMSWVER